MDSFPDTEMTRIKKGLDLAYFAGIDTMFVLFFLSLEYGRAVNVLSLEGVISAVTLIMLLFLPYHLLAKADRPTFLGWAAIRVLAAVVGLSIGIGLASGMGTVLPQPIAHVPMTMLIIAAMISCVVQFSGLLKLDQTD